MEYFFLITLIICALLSLAILTNLQREHRRYEIKLKTNCLLTRQPVVFVTGPRSLFYFRKYWNAYPEILAEHGYEVFTLHLPWRGPARTHKMKEFLNSQASESKKYHFICDLFSSNEFSTLFEQSTKVASITVLKNEQNLTESSASQGFLLSWSYQLHQWNCFSLELPKAEDLGLQFPNAASWLLEKMQEKGEQDHLC